MTFRDSDAESDVAEIDKPRKRIDSSDSDLEVIAEVRSTRKKAPARSAAKTFESIDSDDEVPNPKSRRPLPEIPKGESDEEDDAKSGKDAASKRKAARSSDGSESEAE